MNKESNEDAQGSVKKGAGYIMMTIAFVVTHGKLM